MRKEITIEEILKYFELSKKVNKQILRYLGKIPREKIKLEDIKKGDFVFCMFLGGKAMGEVLDVDGTVLKLRAIFAIRLITLFKLEKIIKPEYVEDSDILVDLGTENIIFKLSKADVDDRVTNHQISKRVCVSGPTLCKQAKVEGFE